MAYPLDDAFRRHVAERCAAFERLPETPARDGRRRAAVALTVVEADDAPGEAALLLTRRVDNLRSHGGQWALPGGRCDAGETPVDTALRELSEEVGINLDAGRVMGLLDDFATRSGYLITPVVVWGGADLALVPNPHEVASIH